MTLPRIAIATISVLLAPMTPAVAQSEPAPEIGSSYAAESTNWDGLSVLTSLIRGSGMDLSIQNEVNWSDLDADDVLFFIYPTSTVDPTHLAGFVRNGGLAVVADDFGGSHLALARMGIRHEPAAPTDPPSYYRDLGYAPVAVPNSNHPLARDVRSLTTNYPGFYSRLHGATAIFSFNRTQSLVAEHALGLIAIADPSIFINRMLMFQGNLQFTINLLRYLHRGQADTIRIVLVIGRALFTGEPSSAWAHTLEPESARGWAETLNAWLDAANDYLLTSAGTRALSSSLAILLFTATLLAITRTPKARLDGTWATLTTATDASATLANNRVLALAIMRDNLDAALAIRMGTPAPLSSLTRSDLLAQVRTKCDAKTYRRLRSLLPVLTRIPRREQIVSGRDVRAVKQRQFERLSVRLEQLCRMLDPS